MKPKKKVAFLKKQNNELKTRIADLENEIMVLSQENHALKNINSSLHNNILKLKEELDDMNKKYYLRLDELIELRKKYSGAYNSLKSLKNSYQNDMDRFLDQLKRQTKN